MPRVCEAEAARASSFTVNLGLRRPRHPAPWYATASEHGTKAGGQRRSLTQHAPGNVPPSGILYTDNLTVYALESNARRGAFESIKEAIWPHPRTGSHYCC